MPTLLSCAAFFYLPPLVPTRKRSKYRFRFLPYSLSGIRVSQIELIDRSEANRIDAKMLTFQ